MAKLNLGNKGSDYKSRKIRTPLKSNDHKLNRVTPLKNSKLIVGKRFNFDVSDFPPIPIFDTTPPGIPSIDSIDYISGQIAVESTDVTDVANSVTSGLRGYRWYIDGVFKEETVGSNASITQAVGAVNDVQVSSIDNDGNESDLSAIQDIDLNYPPAPTNLSLTAENQQIAAQVDAYPDAYFYNWYIDGVLVDTTDTANPNANQFTYTGLNDRQSYKVEVSIIRQYGIEGDTLSKTVTIVDTIAPVAPVGLVVTYAKNREIDIEWNANSESDIKGYNVYLDGSKITSTPVNSLTYEILGLNDRQQYDIKVTAVDLSDNESPFSATVTTIITDDLAPSAPTGLSVFSKTTDTITVKWDENSDDDIKGYNIYVDGVQDNANPLDTLQYQVTGLTQNLNYEIYITAVDESDNESPISNSINPLTNNLAPSTPTSLAVTGGNEEATVSWSTNSEDDIAGYNVFVDGVKYNTSLVTTTTNYAVTGLTNDQEYDFQVSAVDTLGVESSLSAIVAATPVAFGGNSLIYYDEGDETVVEYDTYDNTQRNVVTGLTRLNAIGVDVDANRIIIGGSDNGGNPEIHVYDLDGNFITATGNKYRWEFSIGVDRPNDLMYVIDVINAADNVSQRDYDNKSLSVVNYFGANKYHICADYEEGQFFYTNGSGTIYEWTISNPVETSIYSAPANRRIGVDPVDNKVYFSENTSIMRMDYDGSNVENTGISCADNSHVFVNPFDRSIWFNRADGTYGMSADVLQPFKILDAPKVNDAFDVFNRDEELVPPDGDLVILQDDGEVTLDIKNTGWDYIGADVYLDDVKQNSSPITTPYVLGTFPESTSYSLQVDLIDEDGLINTINTTFTIYSIVYTENFESNFGDWQNDPSNRSDWRWKSGSTGSGATGPPSAYDGTYYIYVETSNGSSYYSGNTDIIYYDFQGQYGGEIEFYYHQYGSNQGTLYLEVYDGASWVTLWSTTGNQGAEWFKELISIPSGSEQVRFRNVAGGGFRGDIGLDLISLKLD